MCAFHLRSLHFWGKVSSSFLHFKYVWYYVLEYNQPSWHQKFFILHLKSSSQFLDKKQGLNLTSWQCLIIAKTLFHLHFPFFDLLRCTKKQSENSKLVASILSVERSKVNHSSNFYISRGQEVLVLTILQICWRSEILHEYRLISQ